MCLCVSFSFFRLKVEAGQNDTGESDLSVPVSGEGDALKVNFGKYVQCVSLIVLFLSFRWRWGKMTLEKVTSCK